jgi:Tfp pilus assembly protein PilO
MNNRIFVIASVIGMVAVLLAGWFLGVSPQLSAAASDDTQRATVDGQNDALRVVVTQLIADEKDLPKWKSDLSVLQRSIPRSADTSAFIDDLNTIAVATGASVSSITLSDAQAYVPPVSAVAAPVDPAAPVDAAAVDPAAAPVVAPVDPLVPAAVTNPLVTTENFVLVPITIQSKGSYEQVLDFVSGVQNGSRLFLATSFKSETGDDGVTTGTTTGFIYVLLNQFDPSAAK